MVGPLILASPITLELVQLHQRLPMDSVWYPLKGPSLLHCPWASPGQLRTLLLESRPGPASAVFSHFFQVGSAFAETTANAPLAAAKPVGKVSVVTACPYTPQRECVGFPSSIGKGLE